MANNLNRVILQGRLVRDPELMKSSSGVAYTTTSIAVNDRVKEGKNWQDSASFFVLKMFSAQAEALCRYCSKGTAILVEGHLKQEKFEKRDGTKIDKMIVVVDKLYLLGKNSSVDDDSSGDSQPRTAVASSDSDVTEDDLPF